MGQLNFSEAEYQTKKRQTHCKMFLARMAQLIPWLQLERQIARHYTQGRQGRPPAVLALFLGRKTFDAIHVGS